MSTLTRLMSPLRRAAQAFFRSDLKLHREEGSVRLVLADRIADPVARVSSAADQAARKHQLELQLMLDQLAEVLDEVPGTREALRHLVFVEHALGRKGLKALKKMPLDVLRRALDQFEGLVTNWSPAGLANLRSKMAVTVIDRETDPGMTDPDGLDSMFSPAQLEAVLDPPRLAAERAIEAARESAFADSTIERLALEFGVAQPSPGARSPSVEMHGELNSPSARDLQRPAGRSGPARADEIQLRELQG
jgi:hypothetical protein